MNQWLYLVIITGLLRIIIADQPVQWDGRAGSFSWLMAAPVDKVDLKTASTATRSELLFPPRISHWLFQVVLRSSMNRKSWDSGQF